MDSRFRLKIAYFTIYGQQFEWDCSLNWTAEPGRIDERIENWFLHAHDNAYAKWLEEQETPKDQIGIRERLAMAAFHAYNKAFEITDNSKIPDNDPWIAIANAVIDEYVRFYQSNPTRKPL